MTVGEIKELLNKYPDDMEVVNIRRSDYQIIDKKDWYVVKGVKKDYWVMRSHPTMSKENKLQEKEYLVLDGN